MSCCLKLKYFDKSNNATHSPSLFAVLEDCGSILILPCTKVNIRNVKYHSSLIKALKTQGSLESAKKLSFS